MSISLHLMHVVSGLTQGDFPYKEHVPIATKIALLETGNLEMAGVYWELLCHFFFCAEDRFWRKEKAILHLDWEKYVISNVEEDVISCLPLSSDDKISVRLKKTSYLDVLFLEGEGVDLSANAFRSFHQQATYQMSDCANVVGYLML